MSADRTKFDGAVRVWDATSGRPVSAPLRHQGLVSDVGFSRDGGQVFSASYDGTARVWDVATGTPLSPPLVHAARVNGHALSPDGMRVATASSDHTARIWPAWPPLSQSALEASVETLRRRVKVWGWRLTPEERGAYSLPPTDEADR